MNIFRKIANANFWYGLALRLTISSTLRKLGKFNGPEVRQTLRLFRRILSRNRHRIRDAQSEFHIAWSAMIFGKTFDFYRPADSVHAYHLRVRSCFYNRFFAENGAPELMAIACRWDLISWAKGIDRYKHGVKFSRPKTLGLDGVDCEFDFEKD